MSARVYTVEFIAKLPGMVAAVGQGGLNNSVISLTAVAVCNVKGEMMFPNRFGQTLVIFQDSHDLNH